ncbi:CHAT domain-containing protein [Rhizoctonia solani]|nr:CHAT domain-containing protein [Rhizoctonia solani]
MRSRELDFLRKAINYTQQACARIPEGHPDLPIRLGSLGTSFYQRFLRLSNIDDLNQSIEAMSKACFLLPDESPSLNALTTLGASHYQKFQRLGLIEDCDKAIEYTLKARRLLPEGEPSLPNRISLLAVLYFDKFKRLGRLGDLDKAIEYQIQACSLTSEGHPHLPLRLTFLGLLYSRRVARLGDLDDLERGINHSLKAASLGALGNLNQRIQLGTVLGALYTQRFMRMGDVKDLNKAIEISSQAILTSQNHPDLPAQLTNLNSSYHQQYMHLGDLDDLDKAIEYGLRGCSLTPEGSAELPVHFNNLGTSYHQRFLRLDDVADLNRAINYKQRACNFSSEENPDQHSYLSNLGMSYRERFLRLGDPGDLEKAIECGMLARSLLPDDHSDLPTVLSQLGASYTRQFTHSGDITDLDNAIECQLQTCSLTPKSNPALPARLANLGTSYSERYKLLSDLGDLEKGIEYGLEARRLYPSGHPELSFVLRNLGHSHRKKYLSVQEPAVLDQAIDYFRQGARAGSGYPKGRLGAALGWARTAHRHRLPASDYLEGYQAAIELLSEVVWLGKTIANRYETIEQFGAIASEAAQAAITSGQFPLALEWLEQGRSIVWNQVMLLRSPLDELKVKHPSLAGELKSISDKLHTASSRISDFESPSNESPSLEQVAQQHHKLAKDYAELLSQIRQLPGFDRFLRPRPAAQLMFAARTGPLVVINVHVSRADALIIEPGHATISHVPLSGFSHEKARAARLELEHYLGRGNTRERADRRPIQDELDGKSGFTQALEMLWDDVVKPILGFLGCLRDPSDLLHITWCTTGPLSFLPLHAAGYYDRPRNRLIDYAVASYTPSLGALLTSSNSDPPSHSSILAISQEITPGLSSLPGTAKELKYIQQHARGTVQYTQLTNEDATPVSVLNLMDQNDWVHLACHAHQSIADPRKSGFFLSGGTLDLSQITERSFKNKGLAFLSACQTATGDRKLADEAVHLASGMLIAGYPSVVATMWAVGDSDAPFVADKVYSKLLKNGQMNSMDTARALHFAVGELRRDIGDEHFARWVPFIHIGL